MKIRNQLGFVVVVVIVMSLSPRCQRPDPLANDAGLEFRILPDSADYAPASRMHVASFVTNHGTAAVYIPRNFSICTDWVGFIDLQILNEQDRDVRKLGCSAESLAMTAEQIMLDMKNPAHWILLSPHEIYGTSGDFDLPVRKGKYRIYAKLMPPRLYDDQKQTLIENQMRFLPAGISAAPVVVNVE